MEHGDSAASDRIASLRRIDLLCDEFESACRQGRTPDWNLDLTGFSAIDRSRLICEYVQIDIAHRRRLGQAPTVDEYVVRFPQFAAEIREAFAAAVAASTHQNSGATDVDWPPSRGSDLWQARTISSTYRAIRRHAEGGLGVVQLAVDQGLQRLVAVKQLRPRADRTARDELRFVQEAQITARLEHPGIVPIYGLGADEHGQPFYAMRFIDGDTLRDAIAQLHRHHSPWNDSDWLVEMRRLLARFISLCQTLHYAHSAGVIHRDIKPGNVILGKFGETWVVDWGMAKVTAGVATDQDLSTTTSGPAGIELTQAGSLMGTPAYMSPEQARGGAAANDPTVDIYGLGATLTHLVSGRPPVTGVTAHEIVEKCRRGETLGPRAILGSVPAPLDAICRKALQFEPSQRYPNAAQLARDVELWLAGEPVSAWTEPLWKRAHRQVRRHKTLSWTFATTLAVVAVMLFAGQRWSAQQSRTERLKGLAESVAVADLAALPDIIRSLQRETDTAPRELSERLTAAPSDSAAARNLRLALSAYGQDHLAALTLDIERAAPEDLLPLSKQMRPLSLRLAPILHRELANQQHGPDARLRIAGVLAQFDPLSPAWNDRSEQLALALCRVPANLHGVWSATFAPIAHELKPDLVRLFHDSGNASLALPAAQLLGLLAVDDAPLLVELTEHAQPAQLRPLVDALARRCDAGIPLLHDSVRNQQPIPLALTAFDSSRPHYVFRDRRRARTATALLALDRPDLVWRWFTPTADPTFQSLVIELAPHAGIDPEQLHAWWRPETATAVKRALLLMLGTLPQPAAASRIRERWLALLRDVEYNDPDPGLHAAAQWVLTRWGSDTQRSNRASASYSPDRRWYETQSGETFVIIPSPVEFLMGSPQDEYFRNPADELHLRRINHPWAMAAREVTYQDAVARVPRLRVEDASRRVSPNVAAGSFSWYDAARYCRVLSEEEGVPEDQMCFPPVDQIGPDMELPDNYFLRTGYRIPSESEWEYACRAGTITAGSFGDDYELIDAYAYAFSNTNSSLDFPARRKPNGLGFFDMLGNAQEICFERTEGHPYSSAPIWGRMTEGVVPQTRFAPRRTYAVRGGDPTLRSLWMRSGARYRLPAIPDNATVGFRPVRTLPADWQPFDVVRVLDSNSPGEVRYEIRGHGQPFQVESDDPRINVEPTHGIAPASIVVNGRSRESIAFQLTLIRTDTQQRRTISGQLTNFVWDVERHDALPASPETSSVRTTMLSSIVPPLRDEGLKLQPASASSQYVNEFETTFGHAAPALSATTSGPQPTPFAVLATGRTPLPPGEYFLQVFGDEFPVVNVGTLLSWGPVPGRVISAAGIDSTLRVSIRTGDEKWRADVFTTTGKAGIWVRMRPVPMPP